MVKETNKDITQLSLRDAFGYLEKIDIQKTICNQALKHIELLNKGNSLKLNYPSESLVDYFKYLVERFDLEDIDLNNIDTNGQFEFNSKTAYLLKKFESKELQFIRLSKWSSLLNVRYEQLKKPLSKDYMDSEEFKDTTSLIESVISQESKYYKGEKENWEKHLNLVKKIKDRKRNIRSLIEHYEEQFALLVLKKYMERVRHYLEQMFNRKVVVKYNSKEWREHFKNNWRVNPPRDIEGSVYERQLKQALESKKHDFVAEVKDGDYLFILSKGSLTTLYLGKTTVEETELEEAREELGEFFNKNQSFYLIIQTAMQAREVISEQSPTYLALVKILKEKYPEEVKQYNTLVDNLKKIEEKLEGKMEDIQQPKKPDLKEVFPNLKFDMREEKDWIYEYVLKENKLKEVIYSIEGNGLFIDMYKRFERRL